MKSCAVNNCNNPVFGKGYCRNHQFKRVDYDNRSQYQKYSDKVKSGTIDKAKVSGTRFNSHKKEEILDESLQNLIADADVLLSRYIRLKYSDSKGFVKCFTCPAVLPIKKIQNGHYISRSHLGLRLLEDNCRPQCPKCNSHHEEDTEPFRKALEEERKGITEYLEEEARIVAKPTRSELKGLILNYREKVKILETKIEKK